jgi:hypothetical protein
MSHSPLSTVGTDDGAYLKAAESYASWPNPCNTR